MRAPAGNRERTEPARRARTTQRRNRWARLTLCAPLAVALLAGCAADPDDTGRAGPPVEPVSWIDGTRGRLWLGAPPASSPVDDDVLAAVARGVVVVRASGCGPVSNGTAFAVAPRLLIGAAHVIAGASDIEIELSASEDSVPNVHQAVVVGYSEARDLALLRTEAPVLPLSIGRARLGTSGVVLGYPAGGGIVASPARIEHYVSATGLWGDETVQRVYLLAADVRAGQSGAPLIDEAGRVVGAAFGAKRGPQEVGLALSRYELLSFLVSSGVDARVDYLGRTVIQVRTDDLSEAPHGDCRRR